MTLTPTWVSAAKQRALHSAYWDLVTSDWDPFLGPLEWAKAEDDGGADKVVLKQEELLEFARVVNCQPHIVGMQSIPTDSL